MKNAIIRGIKSEANSTAQQHMTRENDSGKAKHLNATRTAGNRNWKDQSDHLRSAVQLRTHQISTLVEEFGWRAGHSINHSASE